MSSDRIWPAVYYNSSSIYIRYFPEAKGAVRVEPYYADP